MKLAIVGRANPEPRALLAHPSNARFHPPAQAEAVRAALSKLGWVGDVLANRRTGRIIDGHLRVELAASAGERTVPVRYIDIPEAQERVLLALLDASAALATVQRGAFADLLGAASAPDSDLQSVLSFLATSAGLPADLWAAPPAIPEAGRTVPPPAAGAVAATGRTSPAGGSATRGRRRPAKAPGAAAPTPEAPSGPDLVHGPASPVELEPLVTVLVGDVSFEVERSEFEAWAAKLPRGKERAEIARRLGL